MKATLDHIGIAVKDLQNSLAFYRDALGLEVEAPEDVPSQRVRAHFVPVGESKLELLEATAADSPIAKYVDKRGPGLHHITLRVDDIGAALAQLKARGARLIDDEPRHGAEGALVAFVHPSSAHGVLVELKQLTEQSMVDRRQPIVESLATRMMHGDLELISLSDGYFRMDGGAMFGVVPKTEWAKHAIVDERNRVRLALRPLIVRGTRTMLIDAGLGDKSDGRLSLYHDEGPRLLDRALSAAGLTPNDIDIVLATHLHADHAGGFTMRDSRGTLVPRFPRARYVARRGEWNDVSTIEGASRGNYFVDDFLPLAKAGVLDLVDDDQTIMPGVRVQRTGGHTQHHQAIWIESRGHRAVYPADLVPTIAHVTPDWIASLDRFPIESRTAKQALLARAVDEQAVMFFPHETGPGAGVVERDGRGFRFVPRLT